MQNIQNPLLRFFGNIRVAQRQKKVVLNPFLRPQGHELAENYCLNHSESQIPLKVLFFLPISKMYMVWRLFVVREDERFAQEGRLFHICIWRF